MSVLYRVLLLLATACLLASCGGNPTPPTRSVPTPPPAIALSPESASCHPPLPQIIDPSFGPAVGTAPLWAIGPIGAQPFPVTGPPDVAGSEHKVKVLWVVAPHQQDPIKLRGNNLADGTPLSFEFPGTPPATEVVLYPQVPGIPVQHGQWKEWPSYLYVPVAGCYALEAQWPDGSWRLTFAATGEPPPSRHATPGTPGTRAP